MSGVVKFISAKDIPGKNTFVEVMKIEDEEVRTFHISFFDFHNNLHHMQLSSYSPKKKSNTPVSQSAWLSPSLKS